MGNAGVRPCQLGLERGRSDMDGRNVHGFGRNCGSDRGGQGVRRAERNPSEAVRFGVAAPVGRGQEGGLRPVAVRRDPAGGEQPSLGGPPKPSPQVGVLPLRGPGPPEETQDPVGHIL